MHRPKADLTGRLDLDWSTERRNATRDLKALRAGGPYALPAVVEDLLDIATVTYLTDIATPRGAREEWVRELDLTFRVRDVAFWNRAADDLHYLLYTLTRDNIRIRFEGMPGGSDAAAAPGLACDADCVCLLSGGLDSFAGAAMLVHTGRKPLLVGHQSGNPTTEAAQRHVVSCLSRLSGAPVGWVGSRLSPHKGPKALAFPAPEEREESRRARSFWFMTLGMAASQVAGVSEVYLCENGLLTAALPLTPARSGSLSTRSTHPMAVRCFSDILRRADVGCEIINPFIYQTKGEMLRRVLKRLVPPTDIIKTVSCWQAGRQPRPCGGCIPCLLRRVALLSAGLPDEACMMDLLATPEQYRGTEAYGNLMDLLAQASALLSYNDFDLLIAYPQLLDLDVAGVEVEDVLKTLKRHAAELHGVLHAHFPATLRLLRAQDPAHLL